MFHEKILDEWVEKQRQNLHPRIRKLIALAKWDLNYGPNMEGQDDEEDSEDGSSVVYPGFKSALNEINKSIDFNDIWINTFTGEVLLSEPEGYWDDNPDYDPDEEDSEEKIWIEPDWEDIVHVKANEVKSNLLGELTEYI